MPYISLTYCKTQASEKLLKFKTLQRPFIPNNTIIGWPGGMLVTMDKQFNQCFLLILKALLTYSVMALQITEKVKMAQLTLITRFGESDIAQVEYI